MKASQKRQIYEFDNFRLDAGERQLLRDGEPITLSSKGFDLLLVLVENSGRLVEKEQLYQRVWSDQVVEESNLTVQMSAIRKALGEHRTQYIKTIIGRGYRFIADVRILGEDPVVVIETQTISRIVVEREEDDDYDNELNLVRSETEFAPRTETKTLLPEHGRANAKEPGGIRQPRLVLILSAALILLPLLAAVGAVWFYQSRNRSKKAPASTSRTLRRFTTYGGVPFRVAISPDGKTLAYWQRINGKESLWLGQVETNTSVLLNQQPDLIFDNLVFTPDGSSIYFNVKSASRPRPILGRMPVLGGAITELIAGVAGPVTFAPDGKQIAFLRRDDGTNQNSIAIANASDGQDQRTLLSLTGPEGFSSDSLSWSPDGKTIAFSSYNASGKQAVMSVSVADGTINRISNRDWIDISKVVWLPDGSELLVLSRENVGERLRQIWLISYPGGGARQITNDLNLFLQNSLTVSSDGKLAVLQGHINSDIWVAPHGDVKKALRVLQGVAPRYEGVDGLAWTPDGRLLYSAYVGDSRVIWSINSDGSDLKQLTPTMSNAGDSNVCVTADGNYVVFQSNRSAGIEICRVNSDGSNLTQLTRGGNNSLPSLSPDGKWVIYTTTRDDKPTLSRIPIDGGDPTQISDTTCSFSQVSPDGQYIACMASALRRLLVIPFAGGGPVKSFPVIVSALQGVRMRWTPDGKAIIYRADPQGLWRQALNDETPQMVKGFEELPMRSFAWSSDGKNLAYASGATANEIILIENFK
jgi:DNA-binding winged helix-turn-helix (wHTH) protein/Tol biopolymer transport system component